MRRHIHGWRYAAAGAQEAFVQSLASSQLASPSVPADQPPVSHPKISVWKGLRGAVLFVLLPCLLLTIAIVVWAKLTNQPGLR